MSSFYTTSADEHMASFDPCSTFVVKHMLGQGGSSRVLKCNDLENNEFALKVIKNEKNFSKTKVDKMLCKEFCIAQMLGDHPNVLKCFASVTDAGVTNFLMPSRGTEDSNSAGSPVNHTGEVNIVHNIKYNVLEVADNGSLAKFIRHTGPLEEDIAKFMFSQLASAVKHMHDNLIAHFDIKLENILLDQFYNIKLADFGSAEIMNSHKSQFKYKKGTNHYMAPEVSNCTVSKESYSPFCADMYSLGICLFLMLTGEFPVHTNSHSNSTVLSSDGMDVDEKMGPGLDIDCEQVQALHYLSSDCIDFLNLMVRTNPFERSSIDEVLSHPWLSSLELESDMRMKTFEEFEGRKKFICSQQSKSS